MFKLIESVLFDCWGTIVKAPELMRRGATTEAFHQILFSYGYKLDYEEFRAAYIVAARRQNQKANLNWEEFDHEERISEALQAIGFQPPDLSGIIGRLWGEYLEEWLRHSIPYEETMPLLEYLRDRYALGLVTNFVDGPTARAVFRRHRFEDILDTIVISGEVGYRKPKRLLFDMALSELKAQADASVMVGDTIVADILGPKEIGMKTILVDEDGSKEESYHLPDAVVRTIGEVREALKRI